MTIRELCKTCAAHLQTENADFEARQIVLHQLKRGGSDYILQAKAPVPADTARICEELVDRRNSGIPLYYLLGECEFYGLPFLVGPGVLIPRADTETLVDCALSKIKDLSNPRVLDLCSGSGCVAVSIAKHRPDAVVTAVELHEKAFSFLQRNIVLNQTKNVQAVRGNALTFTGDYDLVTCNPPYIALEEKQTLQREVRKEPETALFAGSDPYLFYRRICANFKAVKGVTLCFEVGVLMDSKTAIILKENGFTAIEITKDLCGIPRVVCGRQN